MERDPAYVVPDQTISEIVSFLREKGYTKVHYIGYADARLIKALKAERRYVLSLMDYWDRHHRESHFFNDEGLDLSGLVVPDWLDGIPSYFDGAPRHEVLLQDMPWMEGQLERLQSPGSPDCIVLFGNADLRVRDVRYDWRDIGAVAVGLRTAPRTRRQPLPAQGAFRFRDRSPARGVPLREAPADRARRIEVTEAGIRLYAQSGETEVDGVEPIVTGPPTKYEGVYRLGVAPQGLASHNLASWRVIEAILAAYGTADFWDLAVAVRGHKHGTQRVRGPQSFVRYCIRNGWLERV
jgi:hypothetical protein